jgi:hypothetical protein
VTAFVCSDMYGCDLKEAYWEPKHVRSLIDTVLAMAGQPPIGRHDLQIGPEEMTPRPL